MLDPRPAARLHPSADQRLRLTAASLSSYERTCDRAFQPDVVREPVKVHAGEAAVQMKVSLG